MSQISFINKIKDIEITDADFSVSESPLDFIRSYENPYPTCQRITQRTLYNTRGQSLTKALAGQYHIARMRVNGEVDTRSIVEFARGRSKSSAELPQRTLLVDQVYTRGLSSRRLFQEYIMKMAQDVDARYVVFAGDALDENNSFVTKINLNLLPAEGDIYRDTEWGDEVLAIDLNKYKESRNDQELLPLMDKRIALNWSSLSKLSA